MGTIAAATTAAGNVLVLLLLSFLLPVAVPGEVDLATKLVPNFMHVVSCAGILFIIKPNA